MSKPILCLDFDGVIHEYSSGWQGADRIPDPLVPGATEFLRVATKHFRVAVFSSRTNQPGGLDAMRNYLSAHLMHVFEPELAAAIFEQIEWPTEKPPAFVTLDDRALTFDGTWPSMQTLKEFKPWNKKPRIATEKEAGYGLNDTWPGDPL